MNEASLYLPLCRGAKIEGWALYRIADGSWGKKPFDIGGCAKTGQGVGLEVKVIKGHQKLDKPLPWRQFADHQIQWLQTFAARPFSLSLAGIYEEETGLMWIYRLESIDFLDTPAFHIRRVQMTSAQRGGVYASWDSIFTDAERKTFDAFA